MKKILTAFIEQVIEFDCRTSYEVYKQELKKSKFKYRIVNEKSDTDGKVFVIIRKQYNNNAFPESMEGSEK